MADTRIAMADTYGEDINPDYGISARQGRNIATAQEMKIKQEQHSMDEQKILEDALSKYTTITNPQRPNGIPQAVQVPVANKYSEGPITPHLRQLAPTTPTTPVEAPRAAEGTSVTPMLNLGQVAAEGPKSVPIAPRIAEQQMSSLANTAIPERAAPEPLPASNPDMTFEQQKQAILNTHNTEDTSGSITGKASGKQTSIHNGPDGPVTVSIDREGIMRHLLEAGKGYLIPDLASKWQTSDMTAELSKREQKVKDNAVLAGHLATLEAMPESMRPAAYKQLLEQSAGEGIDMSSIPTEYNPTFIKTFGNQARKIAEQDKKGFDEAAKALEARKQAENERHAATTEKETERHQPVVEKETERHNRAMENKERAAGTASGSAATQMDPTFDPKQPLSPAEESSARSVAETGIRLPQNSRNPRSIFINARAEQLAKDKGSDSLGNVKISFKTKGDANKFWSVGQGSVLKAKQMEIEEHTKTAKEAIKLLESGNIPALNKLSQKIGKSLGGGGQTSFDVVNRILSAEIGKYLAGGQSTGSEREEFASLLRPEMSPEQVKGALNRLEEMLAAQRKALKAREREGMAGGVINEKSAQTLAGGTGQKRVGISAAEARNLAPGTRFTGLDGKEYVR